MVFEGDVSCCGCVGFVAAVVFEYGFSFGLSVHCFITKIISSSGGIKDHVVVLLPARKEGLHVSTLLVELLGYLSEF